MLAAIEAGGTKFVCAIGTPGAVRESARIATRDPATTLGEVIAFLDTAIERHGPIEAIGIGSFGPLELDPAQPDYGQITTTPKPGWRGTDMPRVLGDRFAVPTMIDTDVNAAALAEAQASGVDRLAYVTVGTGIGVGFTANGVTASGFGHPEAGHLPVRRDPRHGDFPGLCSFHGDCLEGLASGPAIAAAWGASLAGLPADHPAWPVEANYLGQLCASLILTTAPERLVLGGGVMGQSDLFALVRQATLERLAGYCTRWDIEAAESRIVPPACHEPSGLRGAFLLAERAIDMAQVPMPPGNARPTADYVRLN